MNAARDLPATQAMTPSGLLQIAVQQGADLDKLERLLWDTGMKIAA